MRRTGAFLAEEQQRDANDAALALAENAKRVLAETKKFLDEFDEDGIKDDDKDIDRARKEIELLAENEKRKEDVELSFYYHGEEEEEDALSSSSSLSERKKRNTFAEKFLGVFPGWSGGEEKCCCNRHRGAADTRLRSIFIIIIIIIRRGRKVDDGCDRVHRESEEFERVFDYRKLRNGREREIRAELYSRDGVFCEKELRGRVCVLLGRWDIFGG